MNLDYSNLEHCANLIFLFTTVLSIVIVFCFYMIVNHSFIDAALVNLQLTKAPLFFSLFILIFYGNFI